MAPCSGTQAAHPSSNAHAKRAPDCLVSTVRSDFFSQVLGFQLLRWRMRRTGYSESFSSSLEMPQPASSLILTLSDAPLHECALHRVLFLLRRGLALGTKVPGGPPLPPPRAPSARCTGGRSASRCTAAAGVGEGSGLGRRRGGHHASSSAAARRRAPPPVAASRSATPRGRFSVRGGRQRRTRDVRPGAGPARSPLTDTGRGRAARRRRSPLPCSAPRHPRRRKRRPPRAPSSSARPRRRRKRTRCRAHSCSGSSLRVRIRKTQAEASLATKRRIRSTRYAASSSATAGDQTRQSEPTSERTSGDKTIWRTFCVCITGWVRRLRPGTARHR